MVRTRAAAEAVLRGVVEGKPADVGEEDGDRVVREGRRGVFLEEGVFGRRKGRSLRLRVLVCSELKLNDTMPVTRGFMLTDSMVHQWGSG